MTTEDYVREQWDRSQRERTRHRRESRWRRRQAWLLGGLAGLTLLLLAAPSLVSHSSLGRSILSSVAAAHDCTAEATAVRVGWITPLQISGLNVRGASGQSQLRVARIDTELTVVDLLGGSIDRWGEVVLRELHLAFVVDEGRSSLEQDLSGWLSAAEGSAATSATVQCHDVTLDITDRLRSETWQITQSNADFELGGSSTAIRFAGLVNSSQGMGGSLRTEASVQAASWHYDVECESLPLSVISLVSRRFPEQTASLAAAIQGDATGRISVSSDDQGVITANLQSLQVRGLTATDHRGRAWANQLATVDGELVLTPDRLIGRALQATTDFATVQVDGALVRSFSLAGVDDNPLRWLEGLQGSATAEVDLAGLDRAMPGLLPLKRDVQLVSGRAVAQLQSLPAEGAERRSQLVVHSEPLRARAQGRAVVIDPMRLETTVSSEADRLRAERFEWTSGFATAVGSGDIGSGSATVEIDFGRLASMLRPLVDLNGQGMTGSASGEISWNATPDSIWRLEGAGSLKQLVITLPDGKTVRNPALQSELVAVGRWGGQSLQELTQANLTLVSAGLDLRGDLLQPVSAPTWQQSFPVRVQGNGRLEALVESLAPWVPADLDAAEGQFTLDGLGQWSLQDPQLTRAAIQLTQPRLVYAEQSFEQANLRVDFEGEFAPARRRFRSQSLTLLGDAFSASVEGVVDDQTTDLKANWQADLQRIQGSVRRRIAGQPGPVRQVGYRPDPPRSGNDWRVGGECGGQLAITTHGERLTLQTMVSANNWSLVFPAGSGMAIHSVGPVPGRAPQGSNTQLPDRNVWSEPHLELDARLTIDRSSGRIQADSLKLTSGWFATDLSGQAIWDRGSGEIKLGGPATIQTPQVASLLSDLAGVSITAQGVHQTSLLIQANRTAAGTVGFQISGDLGWESAEIAGLVVGRASVPLQCSETSVTVAPVVIPVGSGQLNVAGQIHYRPGPVWIRVQPGLVAQSIQLTPEITDRWMKFVAPLVADATRIQGTFGASIEEAVIVPQQPQSSRVIGRLNIDHAEMAAGPLANQIIGGVEQLQAIARVSLPGPPDPNRTLIRLPAQTVEFRVDSGWVHHKTLFLEIDRAQVVTSGRVSLDGKLDLVAQVPLDARWLGKDLQSLAGQPVRLPIDGTLSRPSLDSRGVAEVVSRMGIQAVQDTAENYLQQQLNKILGGR